MKVCDGSYLPTTLPKEQSMKKNKKEIRFIVLHGLLVAVLLTLLVVTACFKDEVIVVAGVQAEVTEGLGAENQ